MLFADVKGSMDLAEQVLPLRSTTEPRPSGRICVSSLKVAPSPKSSAKTPCGAEHHAARLYVIARVVPAVHEASVGVVGDTGEIGLQITMAGRRPVPYTRTWLGSRADLG